MPSIILSDNGASSGSAGLKQTAGNDGVLVLQTTTSGGTATNAIYVDTSQNVGLGTTSPADILHLSAASPRLTFTSTNNTSGARYNTVGTATAGSHRFQYGGTEVFTIGISGQTVALQNGTVSSGTGIAFPATQSGSSDVNTLDDYEEGTWTPTIQFNGGSVGATYYTQVGTYRKVGSLVVAQCYVSINNKGSSTGVARIAGLPFTSTSTSNNYCAGTFWGATLATISGAPAGYMAPSSTAFTLQSLATTGTLTDLTQSNIQNSTELMITVSYQASA